MKLPAKIKVGYVKFDVVDEGKGPFEHDLFTLPELQKRNGDETSFSWGFCDELNKKIHISKGKNDVETANTLIHETFHAILHAYGFQSSSNEEEEGYISALANGFCEIVRRNPKFRNYLKETLLNE